MSRLSVSPHKFVASLVPKPKHGATVRYDLDENAVSQFAVQLRTTHNHYVTLQGTFVKRGRAGADNFPFPGVVHGHKLVPGVYRLVVTPISPGPRGKPVKAGFKVIS